MRKIHLFKRRKKSEYHENQKTRDVIADLVEKRQQDARSRQAKKEARRLESLQIKQARYYAKVLPKSLTQMGRASQTRTPRKGERDRITVNMVKIKPPILIHKDYYMYQIDTRRLPNGVSIDKLKDQELLETLSFACDAEIQAWGNPGQGLWYLIPRVGGLGIIPNLIEYDYALSIIPKRAGKWAIAVGVSNNNKLSWLELRDKPHILVAGSTGSGKSVMFKNIILTLARNNPPNRFRAVIADFKGAGDFIRFRNLPHIGTPTPVKVDITEHLEFDDEEGLTKVEETAESFATDIITEPDDLVDVLRWANRETNNRNQLFSNLQEKDIHVTNIREYNAKFRRKPMPRVFLFIDEFPVAVLEVDKKTATQVQKWVSAITRKGRSAGIHIVLGSQMAQADVLSGAIMQNIGTRLVGFSTGPQSQTLFGSWFASKISNTPGRMAFKDDMLEIELQTPWISPKLANVMVDDISEKWGDDPDDSDEWMEKIVEYCLENTDGYFNPRKLYQMEPFKSDPDYSFNKLSELGQSLEYNTDRGGPDIPYKEGIVYLLPGVPGKYSRRFVFKEVYLVSQQKTVKVEPENLTQDLAQVTNHKNLTDPPTLESRPTPETDFSFMDE